MTEEFWLAVFLAVIASVNLNVGKAVQKWKVRVLGEGRRILAPEHRKDFSVWVVGMALTASSSVFFSLALKFSDKSSLVSSLNGVGLIGLVIFAWAVMKERIGRQELGGAALVLIGTTVMGYFEKPLLKSQEFSLVNFIVVSAVLWGIFLPASVFSWKTGRLHGLIFGTFAGIILGMCLILGDMALVRAGNDFLGQLRYGYPYVALLFAVCALTVTQFAFWRSKAMVVVPTINSVMILSPVLLEYFTFGTVLQAPQYLGVAVIVAGVVLLTYTETQDKIEDSTLIEELVDG